MIGVEFRFLSVSHAEVGATVRDVLLTPAGTPSTLVNVRATAAELAVFPALPALAVENRTQDRRIQVARPPKMTPDPPYLIFNWLVLLCIDSYDSERRRILQHFSRSTRFAFFSRP